MASSSIAGTTATPAQLGAGWPARPPWRLVDLEQIFTYDRSVAFNDFGVVIEGSWEVPLDVGVENLPDGGTFETTAAPIPPGTSAGDEPVALVTVHLPPTTAVGSYVARLWASDGRTRSGVPITLRVLRS